MTSPGSITYKKLQNAIKGSKEINFTPSANSQSQISLTNKIDYKKAKTTQMTSLDKSNDDDFEDEDDDDDQDYDDELNSQSDETQLQEESFEIFGGLQRQRMAQNQQVQDNKVHQEDVTKLNIYVHSNPLKSYYNDQQGSSPYERRTNQNRTASPQKKAKIKLPKLYINVANCKYEVVRDVANGLFKMKIQEEESEDFDIFWSDTGIPPEKLQRLKSYQRVNHFPGMYALARKNNLGKNLMRMYKKCQEEFDFFPQTWMLPSDGSDFRSQFINYPERTYIIKPEASCQGKGIFLTRDLAEVDTTQHCVVQRYIARPYLMDGLKFDLRLYVLVCGVDPLRIYIYKDGLARLATQPYKGVSSYNLDDVCMHLTNYAVNKHSSNFVQNTNANRDSVGHKRSLKFTMRYLKQIKGEDTEQLWESIKDLIVKTLISAQPSLANMYRACQPDDLENSMCFEILGFDVLLDHKCKPYLLEVNHSPSFATDSPLDLKIKSDLIKDTIRLLGLSQQRKNIYKQQLQEDFERRMFTGKQNKPAGELKDKIRKEFTLLRDNYELNHKGDYELIYPNEYEDDSIYRKLLATAQDMWDSQLGLKATKKRVEDPNKPKPFIVSTASGYNKQQQQQKQNQVEKQVKQKKKVRNMHRRQMSQVMSGVQSNTNQTSTNDPAIGVDQEELVVSNQIDNAHISQNSNHNTQQYQQQQENDIENSSNHQSYLHSSIEFEAMFTKPKKDKSEINQQTVQQQQFSQTQSQINGFKTEHQNKHYLKDYFPILIQNMHRPQSTLLDLQQRNLNQLQQKSVFAQENFSKMLEERIMHEVKSLVVPEQKAAISSEQMILNLIKPSKKMLINPTPTSNNSQRDAKS